MVEWVVYSFDWPFDCTVPSLAGPVELYWLFGVSAALHIISLFPFVCVGGSSLAVSLCGLFWAGAIYYCVSWSLDPF